ncbi:kinetochore protein Spc25 [Drosophila simulans]|uniref:Kinetochore protein Spc25 n=1 Tax=Drosophila simulans TaxID=7240 RepID=SPC25_DROSI|nr:kinetochore protein Spc25 [Drosophila simulans]B4R1Z3.1 RecName: Full=Kinetochore protein Spc25 [Drosophila simulans]EDX13145.1 mitch [Drosophila simulans]KMZ03909.1 mitch [Drosophila simulans]
MAIIMAESSYERRVKALYEKQIRMEALEAKFIKKVYKFNSNLLDVKEAACRHQRKVGKLQKVLMERREELDKRVSFIEELDRELEATKLRDLAMKDRIKQQKMLARQRKNEIMESIHTLSKTTETYINQDALPARVKGVTVLRGDKRNQLIPFDLKSTDVEGLDSLCQHLESLNVDIAQWQQLISLAMDVAMESRAPTTPPKEAANCNSIIEIDLTSPTCHI